MTQEEKDRAWSAKVATSIVDDLVFENAITKDQAELVAAIAAKLIFVHLFGGDRPEGHRPPQP